MSRAKLRHVIAEGLAASPAPNGQSEAFLKGFGFVPLSVTLSDEATAQLQGSLLVGLYVPRERAIYVRPRTRTSSAINPDDVTHELEHALQDDVFGFDALDASTASDDARLARRAVYEGDATVIAWGVAGIRAGRSARDAIADGRSLALAQSALLGVGQEMEEIPSWENVPRLTQVESLFPYSAGSVLVAEAFLAGGPALVDGIFRKPPVSTEQVLHAGKYFDGELPIPVAVPGAPPGFRRIASGTMGELRTRALLETAIPAERAVFASAGWGGDAYAIVARGERTPPAVLWSTVWDDAEHAARFAAALEEATRAPSPLGTVAMRRAGARVAWTRGIDDPRALDALLLLPGPTPRNDPPLGHVILTSSQIADEIIVPAGGDPNLRVPSLGLSAHLPVRFASVRPGVTDLVIQDVQRHGRGDLAHEAKAFDASAFKALASSVAPAFVTDVPLEKMEVSDVALPIGPAREARWRFADGSGEARFRAVPFCDGEQTLLLTTVARTEETRIAVDQWIRSVAPTAPGLAPACARHEN